MKVRSTVFCFLLAQGIFAQTAFEKEVAAFRAEQHEDFFGKESRFNAKEKKILKKVTYFPADEQFRFKVTFRELPQKDTVIFATSTARMAPYLKYALLHFQYGSVACSLYVYQSVDLMKQEAYKNYLFLPFRDLTNGSTTYGGGRYIDFSIPADPQNVYLDFNRSYHPYCAYSDRFSCPVVPPENVLPIAINAGVKMPGGVKRSH
ncbi:MAG: DUF1684 domain-containing protein [Bacteroidia bacterium]|nr:DUF1684 domain-containing protein [Bacteroidia bacterium]